MVRPMHPASPSATRCRPQFTVTGVSSGAGSCGNVGNVVTCTLAALVNAASWAITVYVTTNASTPAGTYLNTAIG